MRKIKGFIIRKNGSYGMVEMDKTLSSYYKHCDCTCIDVVFANIGPKNYDLVVDDEGLLKNDVKFTAYTTHSKVKLAGNILVFGNDGRGGFKSITKNDIRNLLNHIKDVSVFGVDNFAQYMLEFEYAHYNK